MNRYRQAGTRGEPGVSGAGCWWRNRVGHWLQLCWLMLLPVSGSAQTIYKYQDANGVWHFNDKAPAQTTYQQLEYESASASRPLPRILLKSVDGMTLLVADNPWYAPVHFQLSFQQPRRQRTQVLVPARSQKTIPTGAAAVEYQYQWTLGDPAAVPVPYLYYPPVPRDGGFRITQAFDGAFSHTHEPSRYAIDIAMPVGTIIRAARPGVVVNVKDDYPMGSVQSRFFVDKANYVQILHDDGTLATYGHILLGGAMVAEGDSVGVGQPVAKSGSTGFSSGPHLHFVIWRNTPKGRRSVPFELREVDGRGVVPLQDQTLWGY